MITLEKLIECERKFGGLTQNVPRNSVSKNDPRTPEQIRTGGMQGGDRMLSPYHQYGPVYSHFLANSKPKVIVEIGILTGIGLATWCDLYPEARVIGLDIDLINFWNNKDNLENKGAFQLNEPEVYKFDQLDIDTQSLNDLLLGMKIDIVIDDGCHFDKAIVDTYDALNHHLNDEFVYFIEDNINTPHILNVKPDHKVAHYQDQMTVITNRT